MPRKLSDELINNIRVLVLTVFLYPVLVSLRARHRLPQLHASRRIPIGL